MFNIFAECDWNRFDTYNMFIRGFGAEFANFNEVEMASFCESLGKAGLRQEDIFQGVLEAIQDVPVEGEEANPAFRFNRVHWPLFDSACNLGFTDAEFF